MKNTTNYVNYEDIDPRRIVFKMPTMKSSVNAKGVTYYDLPIKYRYPGRETEEDFLIDGPIMTSKGGAKLNEFGKWHMAFTMDEKNPEIVKFMSKIEEIYRANVNFIISTNAKVIIGMPKLTFEGMESADMFRSPLFVPTNKETKLPIEGASKLFNPALLNNSKFANSRKTLFTDCSDDLNPIDLSVVRDTQVTCIPRFHISGDYIAQGKIILQIKMISAVVADIVNTGISSQQFDAAKKLREADPNAPNRIKDMIAKTLLERKMEQPVMTTTQSLPVPSSPQPEISNQMNSPSIGNPPSINPTTISTFDPSLLGFKNTMFGNGV